MHKRKAPVSEPGGGTARAGGLSDEAVEDAAIATESAGGTLGVPVRDLPSLAPDELRAGDVRPLHRAGGNRHGFLTEVEIKRLSPDALERAIAAYDAAIAKQQSETHRAQRVRHKLRCELKRRRRD